MKLQSIVENDISRRDFLKQSASVAASVSPLVKFLTASGVTSEVAQKIASGSMPIQYTVATGTHYGTGGVPELISQFKKVSKAAGLTKSLGRLEGFGSEEDAYFTGQMHPNLFIKLQKAAVDGTPVKIGGSMMEVIDDGDYLELFGSDNNYAHIFKGELPSYIANYTSPVDPNQVTPIKTWWENYGTYGNESLDGAAIDMMDEFDLEFREGDEEYIDELEKRYEEDEELEERWKPEPEAASMHQWFEQKLQHTLKML